MRRDIGRHTNGDAGAPVEQKVGDAGGQHLRLLEAIIEIGHEGDRLFLNVNQHLAGDTAQPGFGIPHGRRGVIVHAAEIALPVYQWIAHGEVLRHTYHGIIDRCVSMRVIFTQNLTHNTGALTVRTVSREAHVVYRVENTAMYRFQSITDIGQSTGHDDAHRVIEIRALHLLLY